MVAAAAAPARKKGARIRVAGVLTCVVDMVVPFRWIR